MPDKPTSAIGAKHHGSRFVNNDRLPASAVGLTMGTLCPVVSLQPLRIRWRYTYFFACLQVVKYDIAALLCGCQINQTGFSQTLDLFLAPDCNQITVVYQCYVEVYLSTLSKITIPTNGSLCLLRLSAIGDVCHAAAMVHRIRTHRPDIRITWIIGKIEYQLLKGMDGVDFVVYDKKNGRQGMKAIKAQFKDTRFDVLCIMQIALRANLLSRAIRAKVRLGFDKARSKEGHSLFINKRIAAQHQPHVLEGFMAFADAMGIPPAEELQWSLPLSSDDLQVGVALADNLGDYAVICPAASKAERNWTAEGYASIANWLVNQGLKVLLCGGPAPLDRQIGDAILAAGATVEQDLIGKTTLKELAGVLARAKVVVAPDTGPAHMATTVGTPVVGLYAHSNPIRTGPYLNRDEVVSVYADCIAEQHGKPWQSLPWGTRAKGESLMARIQPEQVENVLAKVLNK